MPPLAALPAVWPLALLPAEALVPLALAALGAPLPAVFCATLLALAALPAV